MHSIDFIYNLIVNSTREIFYAKLLLFDKVISQNVLKRFVVASAYYIEDWSVFFSKAMYWKASSFNRVVSLIIRGRQSSFVLYNISGVSASPKCSWIQQQPPFQLDSQPFKTRLSNLMMIVSQRIINALTFAKRWVSVF